MLARDVTIFPSIAGKTVRIVKYTGRDKSRSDFEQEGKKGYAVGFTGMMRFLMERLPKKSDTLMAFGAWCRIFLKRLFAK